MANKFRKPVPEDDPLPEPMKKGDRKHLADLLNKYGPERLILIIENWEPRPRAKMLEDVNIAWWIEERRSELYPRLKRSALKQAISDVYDLMEYPAARPELIPTEYERLKKIHARGIRRLERIKP